MKGLFLVFHWKWLWNARNQPPSQSSQGRVRLFSWSMPQSHSVKEKYPPCFERTWLHDPGKLKVTAEGKIQVKPQRCPHFFKKASLTTQGIHIFRSKRLHWPIPAHQSTPPCWSMPWYLAPGGVEKRWDAHMRKSMLVVGNEIHRQKMSSSNSW